MTTAVPAAATTPHAGDMRASRLASLRAELASAELDALLVSAPPNARYLTGFSGSSSLLVVSQADAVLLTDFRYR